MVMSILLIAGTVLGIVIGTLSHPKIYGLIFGGRRRSGDHKDSEGF